MVRKIVAIVRSVIFLSFLLVFAQPENKELLVVVLMVKNEAAVICQTLQPFVDAGVDSFFIFDTGSTDETPEIVVEYFVRNKIKYAYVAQEPFIDFATSRNRALELAEQQFPRAIFMIMPDAEWYLEGADQLIEFCRQHVDEPYGAYFVRLNMPTYDFYLQRLLRCAEHPRFVGAIHERLTVELAPQVSELVFFKVRPSLQGQEATRKRLGRDRDILLKEYVSDPYNTRALFFLGQTYENLDNFKEAYRFYRLCFEEQLRNKGTKNWCRSQAYEAAYNSALVAEKLSQDGDLLWEDAFVHYLEAYSLWSCRAEPLVKIALHYWKEKNMPLCFLFASRAAELPFPSDSVDVVERAIYDFNRYDLLGACAGNLGKWKLSEWALRKALEVQPYHVNLQRSLSLIEQKKDMK